ncbi:hypothetical protein thsrh120_56780 [Rhizobium sp. No.120]
MSCSAANFARRAWNLRAAFLFEFQRWQSRLIETAGNANFDKDRSNAQKEIEEEMVTARH